MEVLNNLTKMREAALITIVLAMSIVAAGGVAASTAQQPPNGRAELKPSISAHAMLVNIDVLVTDQDGRILEGLKKENFRILDEDKPQAIEHFEQSSEPLTVAILMEYSGIASNRYAYKAAAWGSSFLNHLEPLDWVALVTFDAKPTVKRDFTRNKAEVRETMGTLSHPVFREANLFDAITDTLDRLDRVKGRKAVLLLSTGANTFGAVTLDETLARIRRSSVPIFSVGLAEAEAARPPLSSPLDYLQARNQLQTFAKLSGGSAWFPRFEGEMPEIFKSVGTILRSRYSIDFAPQELARDGKYHKVKVQIVQPDGSPLMVTTPEGKRQKPVVHSREGYIAPGPRAED